MLFSAACQEKLFPSSPAAMSGAEDVFGSKIRDSSLRSE